MRTVLIALLALVTLALHHNDAAAEHIAGGVKVIVIDAGHGGAKFPGAYYRGVYEKDLNLKVALKLGKLIETGMPGVKVVYTRKTDKQLAPTLNEDLQARADIANRAGGDLFISIHANAARSAAASGVETLIMGESSRETKANEAVLFANNKEEFLDMADAATAAIVRAYIQNLQFTYGEYSNAMARCIQKRYASAGRRSRGIKPQPLKVLYATDMPGVLTEIGFMSNPQEFAYITSDKGQNEIARALYEAVKDYAAYVQGTLLIEDEPAVVLSEEEDEQVAAAPAQEPAPAAAPAGKTGRSEKGEKADKSDKGERTKRTGYAIQLCASVKPISLSSSEFKSYKGRVKQYTAGGKFRYKYCVGEYADRNAAAAALPEVRKTFPQAFIIRFEGERIAE